MSRPLDRACRLPELGAIDKEAGEFWAENPMEMPKNGENLSAYERNKVYLNTGGGRFMDVSFASSADIDSDSRGVIASDFDRDGAADLLVVSVGGGTLRLFRNTFPHDMHRVRVELIGTDSNVAGIGARVTATCGQQSIVRDLFTPNGFAGQAPPELLIGVGKAEVIDVLTVRWPTGRTQTFQSLDVDCTITIREGDDEFRTSALKQIPAK